MSDRSYAQSLQDDEDHRLALCGLTPDERSGEELEDLQQRHFDFIFASGHPQAQPPQTRSGTKGVGGPPSPRSHALGPTPLSTA